MVDKETKSIKIIGNTAYEIIPTEKGYAYVIFLASTVLLMLSWFAMNSTGMLYNDFLTDRGEGVKGVTTITGLGNGAMSVSGVITNVLIKKFTQRQVQMFGAILITIGWFMNYFADSLLHLIFAFSIFLAMGQGIITSSTLTIFNQYFVEKRAFMYAFCQIIVSVGSMGFPIFVKYSFAEYGFRGTVLIISSIVSHAIFCAILMHPLEWHSKMKPLYDIVPQSEKANLDEHEHINVDFHNNTVKKPSKLTQLYQYLDLDILKDLVFLNITIGMSLSMVADITFMAMFPMYLYTLGMTVGDVATLLSLTAFSDLLGRIAIAVISKLLNLKSRTILYIGGIILVIAKLVFIYCHEWKSILILTCIMGFVRPTLQITIPMIYSEHSPQKFTATYGLAALLCGLINLCLSPVIGFIRDYVDSYTITFYVMIGLSLPCLIMWTAEYLYYKTKR